MTFARKPDPNDDDRLSPNPKKLSTLSLMNSATISLTTSIKKSGKELSKIKVPLESAQSLCQWLCAVYQSSTFVTSHTVQLAFSPGVVVHSGSGLRRFPNHIVNFPIKSGVIVGSPYLA